LLIKLTFIKTILPVLQWYVIKLYNNPCTRCGEPRIVLNSLTEKVGESLITRTQMVCSDPTCQTVVDKQLETERVKRESFARGKGFPQYGYAVKRQ